MPRSASFRRIVLLVLALWLPLPTAAAVAPATLRVDLMHTGSASSDCASFTLENTQRRFRSRLPMSKTPTIVSTSSRFSATWVCMYRPSRLASSRPAMASCALLLVGAKRGVTA